MAEAILVVKTYEESRLDFFKEQLAAAHRRLDWSIKHNPDCYDNAEKGEVVSFYEWAVKMAETALSSQPTGQWEFDSERYEAWTHRCSECGELFTSEKGRYGKYCHNCGVKMEVYNI